MNSPRNQSNSGATDEWSQHTDERPHPSGGSMVAESAPVGSFAFRPVTRKATVAIILAFWLLQYFAVTALMLTRGLEYVLLFPRAIVSAAGALLSFTLAVILNRVALHTLSRRAVVAAVFSLVAPAFLTAVNWLVFNVFPVGLNQNTTINDFANLYLYFLWVFGSLAAIMLAVSYAGDVREREGRISALQSLAHAAHLQALRYQLNPHFLFNALNSIAGLLSRKRAREAELMTVNLGDFLRNTLVLDPQMPITLRDEVRLQQLYLEIERVRFPDRLKVSIDIPEELQSVLVPSLITQPLIENSIKFAVMRSSEAVQLTILARSNGDRLSLVVEDSGGDSPVVSTRGTQVGLSNAADRLRAHYGKDVELRTGFKEGGGFRNVISIPLQKPS